MDMGFLMPVFSKWVTSQFQFIKDRSIRDVDTKESIWQRIYPQENGSPVLSPTGKYWVKVRFQGKERLVEIDDRMPCDSKRRLMFPRTMNNFEIWPHLLLKALLKIYSYKWYSNNSQFDSEVGDGSVVYSLTGLIPERISFKDPTAFEREGLELLRSTLSDDHYFGKKSYVTCFCESDSRPKLPSQATTLKKIDFGGTGHQTVSSQNINFDTQSMMSGDDDVSVTTSPKKMLNKLRDAASLAIQVTIGRKLSFQKPTSSANIITGFGYSLLDLFENQFVDMDTIVKKNDQIEEVESPFASPKKRKFGSLTKDEYKQKRREEKRLEL